MIVGQARGIAGLAPGDARRQFPRFQPGNHEANLRLAAPLRALARAHAVTPARLALAWMHAQARRLDVTAIPITGARHRDRVADNVAAASLELSAADMAVGGGLTAAVQGVAV